MQLILNRDSYGKALLIAASILIWMIVLVLLRTWGYHETWGLWKVPSWIPPFLDFRLIPGSAESFAHGFEPSVENPYDPTERIFNYPAFWRLFFYTGITQEDTVWISITMLVLFFIGLFLFPEKLSIPGAIGILFVVFSPSSMLLYERGNVDLIVFFLCTMIVLAAGTSIYLATFLIMVGSIMKLFPILGLSVLLKEEKNRFLWVSAACLTVLIVYMAATWSSVRASWTLTMRGDDLSYGTDVFVDRYGEAIRIVLARWLSPYPADLLIRHGPMAAGLILLFVVVVFAFRNSQYPEFAAGRNFSAFRMGASIYVGTFLLGNNWDYRLAFLILVVPQLVEWMGSRSTAYRFTSWASLLLILLSCWHLWLVEIPMEWMVGSTADSLKFWIVLDEAFNWLLFASLGYLFFTSAPAWVKELPWSLLRKKETLI
jgi:hypothetical protein